MFKFKNRVFLENKKLEIRYYPWYHGVRVCFPTNFTCGTDYSGMNNENIWYTFAWVFIDPDTKEEKKQIFEYF